MENAAGLHRKLNQLLPEMQAVRLGPRFILHGRAFPESVVQHGAAVLTGLAACDVPLRHPVAVGVLLLQLRQLFLHLHFPPDEDRHTLIGHGLAERVEHLPQRDERHHLNIHPFEHPHSLVPPARATLFGGLHELADGPCHRLNAAFQEHFPVAGIRFRITFGVAGHRRVVAVPAPVGHFLFKLNLAGEKWREGQAVVLVVAVGVFGRKTGVSHKIILYFKVFMNFKIWAQKKAPSEWADLSLARRRDGFAWGRVLFC